MRKVFANFDEKGVYVYQAFRRSTVTNAEKKGTFGKGFGLDRITWIKPSFAWILQRSKYASKHRMDGIARIKITHESWRYILANSIQTVFDRKIFKSESDWIIAHKNSDIIHQWDPERDLSGIKIDRKAIQIGLRGKAIRDYVNEWIISVEDVTDLAIEIGSIARMKGSDFPEVPVEEEYPTDSDLKISLGYDIQE